MKAGGREGGRAGRKAGGQRAKAVGDEAIKELTKLGSIVGTVDDVSVVLLIERSLSAEFTAEKLGWVGWGTAQSPSDVGHVRDDGLDTITLALDLGHEEGHAMRHSRVSILGEGGEGCRVLTYR